ncbi:MAG: rod shape-determining protein MreC, partial [Bacteroidia bacterium]
MRNLINFVYRNHFFFLFLVFELVCVLLMMKNRSYQSTSILNSANSVSANLYTAVANGKEYLLLKEENEKLAKENAILHNQVKSAYDILPAAVFIRRDTLYRKKYAYIPGKVINTTTNRRSNYLTLNVGSRQGVEKDYAIVNS